MAQGEIGSVEDCRHLIEHGDEVVSAAVGVASGTRSHGGMNERVAGEGNDITAAARGPR
jgi:hypothetical protein